MDAQKTRHARRVVVGVGRWRIGKGKTGTKKEEGWISFFPHFLSLASPPFNVASLAFCFLDSWSDVVNRDITLAKLVWDWVMEWCTRNPQDSCLHFVHICHYRGAPTCVWCVQSFLTLCRIYLKEGDWCCSLGASHSSFLARKSILELCFWDSLRYVRTLQGS